MGAIPSMRDTDPWAALQKEVISLRQQVQQIRSAVGTLENATIGSGGVLLKGGGSLLVEDGGGIRLLDGGSLISEDGFVRSVNTETNGGAQLQAGALFFIPDFDDLTRFGYIRVFSGEDAGNNMWVRPPQAPGTSGSPTRLSLRGPGGGLNGAAWLYSDGQIILRSGQTMFLDSDTNWQASAGGTMFLTGAQIQLNATGSDGISMYGTPTTSSAANMFLGTVGGQWQVARSTSSLRYKQDVEAHEVDVEGVKAWQRSRWVDIYDAENVPVPFAPREHVGFIAEQVHELTPEFVRCDDEGEPDALEYDRMAAVGLHAWCEQLQGEVNDLKAERDTQAQQIAALIDANAALAHRLETLEADRG